MTFFLIFDLCWFRNKFYLDISLLRGRFFFKTITSHQVNIKKKLQINQTEKNIIKIFSKQKNSFDVDCSCSLCSFADFIFGFFFCCFLIRRSHHHKSRYFFSQFLSSYELFLYILTNFFLMRNERIFVCSLLLYFFLPKLWTFPNWFVRPQKGNNRSYHSFCGMSFENEKLRPTLLSLYRRACVFHDDLYCFFRNSIVPFYVLYAWWSFF